MECDSFADIGRVGGHQDMTGASIPPCPFSKQDDEAETIPTVVSTRVAKRFFETLDLAERDDGDT